VTPVSETYIPFLDSVGRLVLAAVLGGVIGAEREWRRKSAGLRTNTLIAFGSALFTIVAIELAGGDQGDVGRIPAQVVTGIGFLGAGVILRGGREDEVHGLTTAATIWVNAAIGMCAGAGRYRLAVIATTTALIVLTALLPLQRQLERRAYKAGFGPEPAPSKPPRDRRGASE
jgi:putative Mg2+ transporter-C (MgtC) family protein